MYMHGLDGEVDDVVEDELNATLMEPVLIESYTILKRLYLLLSVDFMCVILSISSLFVCCI